MLIEVGKPVAAPAVIVFATVADIMHWPQILSAVQSVEALDSGPARAGTKLRVTRMMLGHLAAEDIEVIEIEKSRRLRLACEARGQHYERDHLIDALELGSRLTLIVRPRPRASTEAAALPLFTPFLQVNLRDELERDLGEFAAAADARWLASQKRHAAEPAGKRI